MNRFVRLAVASRAFCIATVLGLTLAFDSTAKPAPMVMVVLLIAVSGLALVASVGSTISEGWIALVESALAAAIIAWALPDGRMLLPYLTIPPLLAGISSRAAFVSAIIAAEVVSMSLVISISAESVPENAELAAPWVVTAVGTGVLGAWLQQLRAGPSVAPDDASYESARRLLSQLRTVARRLSSGLDPVSMASQLLAVTHEHLDDTHAAVFVRTEGGVLAPLGYRGYSAKEGLLPEGHVVDTCWAEMEPSHAAQPSGLRATRYRIALPLRNGSRMIGVVLCEAPEPPDPQALAVLMREFDEQSLRLDTALVFDEVRSIATMEERQRLAREIHDGVAQEIASLGYAVDDLSADAVTEKQQRKLQQLRDEITRVVSELRLSIFDLRSEISPSAGLGSALSDYVRAVGQRSDMTVHLTLDEAATRMRSEVETELLRIAQEAITNARKHSAAANLWVDCNIHPPYARVRVRDDGKGMGAPRPDSYGLKIMRERAERIGAILRIGATCEQDLAQGTTVTVTVGGDQPGPAVA